MTFNATIKFGFVNSLTFDLGLGYLQFTSWNLAAVSRTLSVVPTVIVLVRNFCIYKLKDIPNFYFTLFHFYRYTKSKNPNNFVGSLFITLNIPRGSAVQFGISPRIYYDIGTVAGSA